MPSRILFNGLKHHRQIIVDFINTYDTNRLNHLGNGLVSIGTSQMDLYIGNLSEPAVREEVIHYLTIANTIPETAYKEFLYPEQYRSILLSDQSGWVLRIGERPDQYIHIHPARYSVHTIRVKAATLKTAIGVLIWQKQSSETVDLTQLNYLRKDILNLSPIRSLEDIQSVWKIVSVLTDG